MIKNDNGYKGRFRQDPPSRIIDHKHHTLFVFFLILYTHWGLLRYVWKCWNWYLCTTWVLYTRLLTNAKKATVSVLYWYTSFPSSLNSEFLKTQGSSSSEEETSFVYIYVFFFTYIFCVFLLSLGCGVDRAKTSIHLHKLLLDMIFNKR